MKNALSIAAVVLMCVSLGLAQENHEPKDRADHGSQADFDRQMKNARDRTDAEAEVKNHEAMRDKTRDHELPITKDVSIGAGPANGAGPAQGAQGVEVHATVHEAPVAAPRATPAASAPAASQRVGPEGHDPRDGMERVDHGHDLLTTKSVVWEKSVKRSRAYFENTRP
jgi:hypothetical protein